MRRIPNGALAWPASLMPLLLLLFIVLAAPPARAAAADEPEIAVEASATEIFIGESVDYVVEIRNAQNPAAPDLSALRPDFDIVPTGDESHNQSSTFIINGRVSQQTSFGHSYRFRLTPKRTGRFGIAAPSATIDGKTISGRSLPLNVIAPEPQDLVIPEIKTSRDRVYPTQPFEVMLRILVRPLPDDTDRDPISLLRRRPPHLDVNWVDLPAGLTGDDKTGWLEKLLSDDGTGFTLNQVTTRSGSFFEGPRLAVFNLYQGRESRRGRDGQPINYFVYELKRRLTADKAGTYALGPAIVKGSFADGDDGGNYTVRRLVAVAPRMSVEVREVPSPRPATFCGGIGSYRLATSASPTSLRVGDPLTLTLDIARGPASGSFDLVSAPDLMANSKLATDFEVLDKSPTGRRNGDAKRFEYALRPKRAGVAIPALTVSVFNPDTETFTEIASPSIALDVSAANRMDAADLVGSVAGSATPEIKSRAQGIFQNVIDPAELKDERVNLPAFAALAVGSWLGAGALIALVSIYRRKSGDLVWQRKRFARRTAEKKLADARKLLAEGRSKDALRMVRSAVIGLIADKQNVVAEGLTTTEADALLARTAVPAPERTEVMRLLEAMESAEYGSGVAYETAGLLESAVKLIPNLARHLERGV